MRIYLTDQTNRLNEHLEVLRQIPLMPYEKNKLVEKNSSIPVNTDKEFSELDTEPLFDYRIFPLDIMTALTEWESKKRKIQVGDTIVQQVFIPPFLKLSQKIVFGVRIKEVFSEQTRVGFSYETLQGHVEKGISTFTIEKTAEGNTIFRIHTFSAPGTYLSRIVAPVFSIPYQAFCTRQALMHVKRQLEA
jgi:uncharacterized protein (UPF0548 family)